MLAEYCREAGISGAFLSGTTGECHSLSLDERVTLTQAWCQAAAPQFPIVAHVGSNSLPESIELAAQARQSGVAGIAVMAPSFFKPSTVDDLIDFCVPIARAAEDLPFYYYHIPQMSGVELRVADFLSRASGRIPNLAGAKYSGSDFMDLQGWPVGGRRPLRRVVRTR